MRMLQSQVLDQFGVRKSVGYTGQQDFLKRRHGVGKCVQSLPAPSRACADCVTLRRYVWPTMDTYVGEWREDVRTGHGMMTFQNGEVCVAAPQWRARAFVA